MIPELVKYNTKRINIYFCIIGFSFVHFRCHVRESAFLGKATHGSFQLSGNSKVTKFKFAKPGYKNILRFDISVNDILFLAVFQCFAKIDSKLDHIFFCKFPSCTVVKKAGQIFHSYVDVPSNIIQVFYYFIVFYRNHMGIASEVLHGADFLNAFFYKPMKIFSYRLFVGSFWSYTA